MLERIKNENNGEKTKKKKATPDLSRKVGAILDDIHDSMKLKLRQKGWRSMKPMAVVQRIAKNKKLAIGRGSSKVTKKEHGEIFDKARKQWSAMKSRKVKMHQRRLKKIVI